MKTCNRCGIKKADSQFTRKKHRSGNYGLAFICKACTNEVNKLRRSNYTEEKKAAIREQRLEYRKTDRGREVVRGCERRTRLKRRRIPEFMLYQRLSLCMKKNHPGFPSVNVILKELGYSLTDLKEHLESQFIDGMNWENPDWTIDHIIPISIFPPVSSPKEQAFKDCHALENLQILSNADNARKGNSIGLRINSHGGAEIVGVKVEDLRNV